MPGDEYSADKMAQREQWPVERRGDADDQEHLGVVSGRGSPMLYDHGTETVYEGEYDEAGERIVPKPDTERDLGADETLGAVIEDIGDTVGWESLSEFAREHLESSEDEA